MGETGGVAAKGRRAAVFCAASLVKDDGRPVVIIDNYDSFTYNLSQVRARARKEQIVPPSSSRAPATLPHPRNPTAIQATSYPLPTSPDSIDADPAYPPYPPFDSTSVTSGRTTSCSRTTRRPWRRSAR